MKAELEQAFMDSFAEYGDAIFRFCMVKVSNQELAEDMTQEVFMRYWQYLRDGKEIQNVRALLYTIANNLAKDWYKRKKADALDPMIEAGYEPTDTGLSQEQLAMYRETIDMMEELEENDRMVLVLRYLEGLGPKDIAEVLGETANTISVRINRAEKRLQAKLGYA
jgi:RNA polymerase sigma factor (sigma-70 family)